jgi:hypothetical protein
MMIEVETTTAEDGSLKLLRLLRGEHRLDIAQTVDQWHGSDYRYVKVIGADSHTYILRQDEKTGAWDLTLFQRRRL